MRREALRTPAGRLDERELTVRPLLIVCATAFAAMLIVLGLTVGASQRPAAQAAPSPGGPGSAAGRPGSTDQRVARSAEAVRAQPSDADGLVTLASALLQKARETGDASYYRRADQSLAKALAGDRAHAGAYTTRGALRLARHDFRGALRDGLRARRLAPEVVKPFAVVVDANVELGRYAAAGKALQRMIDLKPNLDAYARVSYFRELHGDLRGAREALSLALAAGGEAPENAAYVQTLQGNLELARGRRDAAERAYRAALARVPGYVPARAGLARVDAAAGRLDSAIRRLRAVVARLPLPEYVIALGETELAAGRGAGGTPDVRPRARPAAPAGGRRIEHRRRARDLRGRPR